MDGVASPADQQTLVSSFLEIAVGQSADTARQFLQATSWKLEEAVQLFYIGNEGGSNAAYEPFAPVESEVPPAGSSLSTNKGVGGDNIRQEHEEDVRAPLPVIRDVLYDNAISYSASRIGGGPHETHSVVPFRNFEEERKRSGVWELENGSASTVDDARDNLASLYRPPFALMYHGTFKNAKDAASAQNKWLLVNLQSTREFSSHMLNRDTWADEAVAQTIKTNFIFWQVYDDTEEGSKVCTYYKLDSIPVVLVIDPVTGQKMRSWRGMIQPQNLLEDLLPFMDGSPTDHHISLSNKRPRESHRAPTRRVPDEGEDEEMARALAASMEGVKDVGESYRNENDDESSLKDPPGPGVSSSPIITKPPPTYPPLPEEPKGGDRNLLCRVGMRLPDGRRLQRNFLRADPIQLLWSFCWSELEEQDKTRPFRLSQAIPGSAKSLDFDTSVTFEESGLANSMISVTWE